VWLRDSVLSLCVWYLCVFLQRIHNEGGASKLDMSCLELHVVSGDGEDGQHQCGDGHSGGSASGGARNLHIDHTGGTAKWQEGGASTSGGSTSVHNVRGDCADGGVGEVCERVGGGTADGHDGGGTRAGSASVRDGAQDVLGGHAGSGTSHVAVRVGVLLDGSSGHGLSGHILD